MDRVVDYFHYKVRYSHMSEMPEFRESSKSCITCSGKLALQRLLYCQTIK
jgi:hypothetical protein